MNFIDWRKKDKAKLPFPEVKSTSSPKAQALSTQNFHNKIKL